MIKKILLLFFCIIFSSCVKLNTFKNNFGEGKLVLPYQQLERFESYLNGKYYSYEFDRDEYSKSPIAFAISKDGLNSLILMCDDVLKSCGNGVYILQTIEQFSKKTGQDFYIFALDNKIVWGGLKQYISNKNKFENFLVSQNTIVLKKDIKLKINFYDKVFDPQETDACDGEAC